GEPGLSDRLIHYFPTQIRERFRTGVLNHQLGREIAATILTNEVVDRMGPTFVLNAADRSGHPPSTVAKAFAAAVDAFGIGALYRRVEAQDGPGRFPVQAEMFAELMRLTRRATEWMLRRRGDRLDIAAVRDELTGPIHALAENVREVVGPRATGRVTTRIDGWTALGADPELASAIGWLDPLASAPDIVHMAADGGADLMDAARIYFGAGERLRIGWCRNAARSLVVSTAWERLALDALLEDLYGHQAEIARSALAAGGVEAWAESRKVGIERLERTLEEMAAADSLTLAMATVVNSMYRGLSAS
ncbi:MAG: NAD-glutamate dehydrogenase, partial [Alphaproteobacteria bacterium]